MSFLRFTLDVSPLDDEGYGLDGPGFAFTSDGVGVSTLGALTSAASSITIHEVSASAPLDGATGTATSLVTNPVSANAPLGGSYSNATAIVSVIATGGVSLGGLTHWLWCTCHQQWHTPSLAQNGVPRWRTHWLRRGLLECSTHQGQPCSHQIGHARR